MRLENIKDTSSTSQKEKDIAREEKGRGPMILYPAFLLLHELCLLLFLLYGSWRRPGAFSFIPLTSDVFLYRHFPSFYS